VFFARIAQIEVTRRRHVQSETLKQSILMPQPNGKSTCHGTRHSRSQCSGLGCHRLWRQRDNQLIGPDMRSTSPPS
jgi:hypothetical protein